MAFSCKVLVNLAAVVTMGYSVAYAGPLCAYTKGTPRPSADAQPTQLGLQQMTQANNVLCRRFACPRYNFYRNQSIQNASASSNSSGFTIRYNPNFMQSQANRFGTLATIGILSHELGHIIDFANQPYNQPQNYREGKADEYAGCAFALAGAPQQNLGPFINSL